MTGANCLSKSETSRNLNKLATGIFINQNGGGIAANKLPLCLKNANLGKKEETFVIITGFQGLCSLQRAS